MFTFSREGKANSAAGRYASRRKNGILINLRQIFAHSHLYLSRTRLYETSGQSIPAFSTRHRWSPMPSISTGMDGTTYLRLNSVRWFSDPNGPAYLVWYRAVKDSKAPGGVRFVPEVIHNRSGVGSGFKVADLNHDGHPDIITAGDKGVYVFLNKSPGEPVKGSTNPGSVSK